MQGDVPTKDLIFGSLVLAIFLVCVFLAGLVLNRFKNARFSRAWQPLVPIIRGKVIADGGGAATSWLLGTYAERRVCASMIPGRNRYSGETGLRYNYFDIALLETPGAADWTLQEGRIAAEPALRQRLVDAQASAILQQIGPAEAAYNARQRKLTIIQEAGPDWIPPPAHFELQLKALLRLADINAAVN